MRILALLLGWLAMPAFAHEFWIEPLNYHIQPDGTLEAQLVNGEAFAGPHIPYLSRRQTQFTVTVGDTTQDITGRNGDMPALSQPPMGEGLHIVAIESQVSTLTYQDWDKFQRFLDHKDLGDVRQQHIERGFPTEGFKELYIRYSKSLIAVGNGSGQDQPIGLETELVALQNPYTDDLSNGMELALFYQQNPRRNEQIEVFQKSPDGTVEILLYRTDQEGRARFPVLPGHSYMVDAVVLREPSPQRTEDTGAAWETLWANLTFAVPQ